MELVGAEEAGKAAGRLLADFRRRGLPVIHVQHISNRPGASFFLPGTDGANIHESVAPRENETIIQKNFPNSFRATELQTILEKGGIKELVICGMMSQMCVNSTVRAAFDLGYQCTVAHDACAAPALTFEGREISADCVHAASMASLASLFARVVPVDRIIES